MIVMNGTLLSWFGGSAPPTSGGASRRTGKKAVVHAVPGRKRKPNRDAARRAAARVRHSRASGGLAR